MISLCAMAGRWWAGLIGAAGLFASLGAVAEEAKAPPPCTLEPGPIRTVTRVIDGETLILDDGKAVRLIGALAPRARDADADQGAWPPEADAAKALSDLVLARRVKLAFAGRRLDRYGRELAQVFVIDHGREDWVQGALLRGGFARAYGLPGSFACTHELIANEAYARTRHLGLWQNGIYRTLAADRPGEIMKRRGKYERVGGTVVSIGRTKSATYLNFSNDWRSDFTARIDKKVLAANPDFDRSLDALTNTTVVVRGWIERRNGPLIDIADPSQLEAADDAAASQTEAPKEARPAPPEGAEPSAVNLKSL
ncbi:MULTISPECIES: thermonuclease family protein [unclassified Hyphomicrobium]|uniref:thermonuclease family protein n=1 Tax=unclassified Hyphomicrobium TaxID=2619925 RepID=UPI001FCBDD54|nr:MULTISPECIES: thermonuclease family protein [unclassified Hyphomicrobium]